MSLRIQDKMMIVALAAAFSAVGCAETRSPIEPSGAGGPAAAVTQGSGADQSALAAVRAGTAAFHDVDAAVAAGYASPVGGHCDQIAIGAMGVHSSNPALVQTQTLDPRTPEVLLYLPTGGGNYKIVGVEYLQVLLLRNTETGIVSPWFSQSAWPAQYTVVNQAPSLFGQTFQGPMAGHVAGMPWHYDLHVWAWAPNPAGTFEQWNASIACN